MLLFRGSVLNLVRMVSWDGHSGSSWELYEEDLIEIGMSL